MEDTQDNVDATESTELHKQHEPEKPVHRAVNITSRMLKSRIEPFENEEYGEIWKARDPVTGRVSNLWWDTPEEAVDMLAKQVDLELCSVNDCDTHLGTDSEQLYCNTCKPDEYVECAVEGCEYPTSHIRTVHCQTHTWELGREAESNSKQVVTDGGEDVLDVQQFRDEYSEVMGVQLSDDVDERLTVVIAKNGYSESEWTPVHLAETKDEAEFIAKKLREAGHGAECKTLPLHRHTGQVDSGETSILPDSA